MAAGDLQDPVEHRSDLDVAQRTDSEPLDEIREVAFHRPQIELGPAVLAREQEDRLGEKLRVVAREGEQKQDQDLAHLGPELAHHPQVEQVDLVV